MKKNLTKAVNWVQSIPVRAMAWVAVLWLMTIDSMQSAFADYGTAATSVANGGSLGAVSGNVRGVFTSFTAAAYYGSMFGAVVCAILGILQIISAHKKQESIKPGVLLLIGAAALSSIVVLIMSISGSLFGTSSAPTNINTLITKGDVTP